MSSSRAAKYDDRAAKYLEKAASASSPKKAAKYEAKAAKYEAKAEKYEDKSSCKSASKCDRAEQKAAKYEAKAEAKAQKYEAKAEKYLQKAEDASSSKKAAKYESKAEKFEGKAAKVFEKYTAKGNKFLEKHCKRDDDGDNGDDDDAFACPDVISDWNALTGDEPVDFMLVYFEKPDGDLFSVKVEAGETGKGFSHSDDLSGLDDIHFECCLRDLTAYLKTKEELELEDATPIGIKLVGPETEMVKSIGGFPLDDADTDGNDADFDLLELGQTFDDFDYWLFVDGNYTHEDCPFLDEEEEEEDESFLSP